MEVILLLITYFVVMNLIGFIMMGSDKRKSIMHAWRTPEAVLFLPALLGGCIGSILGMHVFHHKTKHWYFRYGLPLILLLQLAILILLLRSPIQFITL